MRDYDRLLVQVNGNLLSRELLERLVELVRRLTGDLVLCLVVLIQLALCSRHRIRINLIPHQTFAFRHFSHDTIPLLGCGGWRVPAPCSAFHFPGTSRLSTYRLLTPHHLLSPITISPYTHFQSTQE